jgi:hypothetical protein
MHGSGLFYKHSQVYISLFAHLPVMKLTNLSLVTKLRLALIAVPVLLIITITIYSGLNLAENKNGLKSATATQVSRSVMEKIDRNFYERFGDVQAYAANVLAVEMVATDSVSEQAQKFINTMTSYYVLYDLMMLVDNTGKVVACNTIDKDGKPLATASLIGRDFSGEEWFSACMSGKGPKGGAWYSDFEISKEVAAIHKNRGWGMGFAAPIRDNNDQPIGVWYNFASWKEVTQGIRREALYALQVSEPGSEILMLNAEGKIIDASHESLVLNETLQIDSVHKQVVNAALPGLTINEETHLQGLAYSTGAYTYTGKHWRCLTIIPKADVSLSYFFTKELICIDIAFLLLAWFISYLISSNIVKRVYLLRDIVAKLGKGDLSNIELQMKEEDELAHMGSAVVKLADGLKLTSTFADEVGKGNFNSPFAPLSEADTLGNALIKMNENLKKAAEEDRKRNWTTEGLAKFSEILRSTTDLASLSEKIIAELVKYLKANQGGLFLVQGEEGDTPQLELIACYAYNRKKYIEKTLSVGEGLLGQAYLEKDTVYLTQLPSNYLQITSGLGESNPRCLLIVPLKIQNKVEGVLEIASFQELQKYEIAFVEKLAETIASSIAAVKINARTRILLEDAQMQSEVMRAQEEEMRQNMEELIATQEEMKRKEAEYLAMLEEAGHTGTLPVQPSMLS